MRLLPLFALTAVLSAQPTDVAALLEARTQARLEKLAAELDGVLGVHVIDLTTGRTLSLHADVVFPQASSIKIPILIELFRAARAQQLSLRDQITVQPSQTVGGSGTIQEKLKTGPVTMTVRDLATAMIESSDNTATNRIITLVGGPAAVNRTLDDLGYPHTRLRRIMLDTAAAGRNEENVSTPREMARLVEQIYRGGVVDLAACQEMIAMMKLVKADLREAIPAGIAVASKPGELTGVRAESGIVFRDKRPYVISVMSTFLAGEANPIQAVARLVDAHFERLARSNRYGNRLQ